MQQLIYRIENPAKPAEGEGHGGGGNQKEQVASWQNSGLAQESEAAPAAERGDRMGL